MRQGRLSGSLTRLGDGTSFLVAGSNVAIASQSNGSVIISSTGGVGGGGGDPDASYLVLAATASLSNERVLTAGTGISISDGGAGNALTIAQTTPFTSASHAGIAQLIHLASSGPFEGFGSSMVCDSGPTPFVTSSTWWTDVSRTKRILDQTVVYNANMTISQSVWRAYAPDGSTVVSTATDTVTYSSVFETSRSRVIT